MVLRDDRVTAGLRGFAAAAGPILDRFSDAGGALTAEAEPSAGVRGAARRRLAAARVPGSPGWADQPVAERADWWASRIWAVLGPASAAPDMLGPVSDRFPVGSAIGAAARGLVICAIAREHGITGLDDLVNLLSRVLLHRDPAPRTTALRSRSSVRAASVRPSMCRCRSGAASAR